MTTNYTKVIYLPGGSLYDNQDYAGPIELSMLTTKHEKRIFGSASFDNVLRDVIKDITKPSIDIELLTSSDRFYLLIEMRKHTYGTEYYITDRCPECGAVTEFKVDLNDMELKDLPEDFSTKVEITLPKSGHKLELKMLTYGESLQIRKRATRLSKELKVPVSEIEYTHNLEKMIVTVDGEELTTPKKTKFINELVGYDTAYISHILSTLDYGYTGLVGATCPVCGSDINIDFSINTEFFRPRFN